MSRPLHRGVPVRIPERNNDSWDSQSKDKTEKEGFDRRFSSAHPSPLRSPFRLLSDNSNSMLGITENGLSSDPYIIGTPRNRHKLILFFLKFSLVFVVILALAGSFWWTISISTASRGHIYHGYRRLHEQLVSDLLDIGEISYAPSRLKELEFCYKEFENYVPCFNVSDNLALGFSDGNEFDRQCGHELRQDCLLLSPPNYKIPLRWPTGRDIIWVANVKLTAEEVLSSGSLTKRMMMLDEEQISFRSASLMFGGVEDYSHQIAEMIGLRNESNFVKAGVRTILDIDCGYGSFGAHLFQNQLLTMCIASYEPSGSQVQLTLERGLPAMVASFNSKQLPYPSLSFDMLHCARCGIDWDRKDGTLMIEADRLLRPGGYVVWTSPLTNARDRVSQERWKFIQSFAENLCWDMIPQQDETVVWKKTSTKDCYSSRKNSSPPPLCGRGYDVESPYYRELKNCIGGTHSSRWISIEKRETWPSIDQLNKKDLEHFGLQSDEFSEDSESWRASVHNYWSLLSPLIFSDHPKRPGDEDPPPPYNMLRNVLDMNAHFGGFNSALLHAGKSVWVMNVVPLNAPNYLPLILDRGYVGVMHDWCEAFPTYPRTYDLVHAAGLLSLEFAQQHRCAMLDVFIEIDRILRPEGWIIIRDTVPIIESARALTKRLKWDARVVEIESDSDQRLLICQKPFFKKQAN
ncbi:probable pectin methyltransferase QUA2 [Vigna radiata var. radiata]|uniref:Methyltransferase n=1 Tax=Vigna radiata var. radiata TaxID=3916 RepID=A0A1S3U7E9_VIGRR|nr:probable pectin methyltransferase QUA2 [Vigna radiata var. radiata]XP_014501959.1 probable pectin methyltransferase QUA2 [Vigna radiata var. radiata]